MSLRWHHIQLVQHRHWKDQRGSEQYPAAAAELESNRGRMSEFIIGRDAWETYDVGAVNHLALVVTEDGH